MRPFADLRRWAFRHPQLGHPRPEEGGAFMVHVRGVQLRVIASWNGGWDHVSVSRPNRCPTWNEMDEVKRLFFRPEEVVMQLHPAEADYINRHPFTLHLWRPHDQAIPQPPKWMI